MRKLKDITGKKYGRLTVISFNHKVKYKDSHWLCKCDCGKEKVISMANLRSGGTKSCGCLQHEFISNLRKLTWGESAKNTLLCQYKQKAKERGISFNLSAKKFYELTKQECFYCGQTPKSIKKTSSTNGEYVYNGIDRINSDKGYTKTNVVSCCGRCNKSKGADSQKDFFDWVDKIYIKKHSRDMEIN